MFRVTPLLVTAAVSVIKADVIMLTASREDERKCPRLSYQVRIYADHEADEGVNRYHCSISKWERDQTSINWGLPFFPQRSFGYEYLVI
jgi:hypothetical protein